MTMTSTYDHRIIQGAESGRFLARIEEYLQGERRLLRGACSPRWACELGPPPALPAPARRGGRRGAAAPAARSAARRARSCCRRCRRPARWCSALPQPRPPRGAPGPARLRARGRPGARPRAARADAGAEAQIPAKILHMYVPGATLADALPAPARDLLRHDRLRDRAHRLPPPARVAARADRVGRLPPAAAPTRSSSALLQAPDRGRRARALHAQGLPRPAPVLDRGPRHDRADARRADPALGRARRPARS